jgi:ATP-dependent exoDNAse (exonuclease V) beta subunit
MCVVVSHTEPSEPVQRLFRAIDEYAVLPSGDGFTRWLSHLNVSESSASIKMMTIHKAKGLEFDTVIVWDTKAHGRTSSAKLLAECPNSPSSFWIPRDTPLWLYAAHHRQEQRHWENTRLHYVACTRAKHTLYNITFINQAS